MIVGTSIDAHYLRRQVGIGTELDYLLRQPKRIFEISVSDGGSKVVKSGGGVDGEGECGDAVADKQVRDTGK